MLLVSFFSADCALYPFSVRQLQITLSPLPLHCYLMTQLTPSVKKQKWSRVHFHLPTINFINLPPPIPIYSAFLLVHDILSLLQSRTNPCTVHQIISRPPCLLKEYDPTFILYLSTRPF